MNYPEGVTGNEPEIVGVDKRESTATLLCEYCLGEVKHFVIEWLDGSEVVTRYECAECHHVDEERVDNEPDPDDLRDLVMEDI